MKDVWIESDSSAEYVEEKKYRFKYASFKDKLESLNLRFMSDLEENLESNQVKSHFVISL